MGGMDDYHRKPSQQQSSSIRNKLKIILLVLSTNILTIYLMAGPSASLKLSKYTPKFQFFDSETLLHELNSTQAMLASSRAEMVELRRRLMTSNSLLETLLTEFGKAKKEKALPEESDGWRHELSGELKLAVGPHKLPLGFTPNLGTDEIYPALGTACRRYQEDLMQYMSYQIGGECPADDVFAQHLMLKGCEPLPRRRCHPKPPASYVEPSPFPKSLWSIPPDSSITWDAYTCKNYQCLVERNKDKGSYDCKDCFDLNGREKTRWTYDSGDLDYGIEQVLKMKPKGTIRIGLDIGGGSGTFAARMREHEVTIVTTTMNFDGPFNNFIASRGLVPLYISVANRLPFFENTLDIVHSMHVLSNWIPDVMLEFALFDIYRVLRPGGLFWLDHFFCIGEQLNSTYVPMFDRTGFKKLRWNAGRKLDRGIEKNEWYLSALLEKPMT